MAISPNWMEAMYSNVTGGNLNIETAVDNEVADPGGYPEFVLSGRHESAPRVSFDPLIEKYALRNLDMNDAERSSLRARMAASGSYGISEDLAFAEQEERFAEYMEPFTEGRARFLNVRGWMRHHLLGGILGNRKGPLLDPFTGQPLQGANFSTGSYAQRMHHINTGGYLSDDPDERYLGADQVGLGR